MTTCLRIIQCCLLILEAFDSADTFYHNETMLYLEMMSFRKCLGEVILAFFKDCLYKNSLQASATLFLEHMASLLYFILECIDFSHLLFLVRHWSVIPGCAGR